MFGVELTQFLLRFHRDLSVKVSINYVFYMTVLILTYYMFGYCKIYFA